MVEILHRKLGQVLYRVEGDSLRGLRLSSLNLAEASLNGRDLSGAVLHHLDLSRSDLRGACLREGDLTDSILDHADLRGCDLSGARLTNATLSGADLRGAVLQGTDLAGANLTGVDLRGTDLSEASLGGRHKPAARLIRPLYDATTVWPVDYSDLPEPWRGPVPTPDPLEGMTDAQVLEFLWRTYRVRPELEEAHLDETPLWRADPDLDTEYGAVIDESWYQGLDRVEILAEDVGSELVCRAEITLADGTRIRGRVGFTVTGERSVSGWTLEFPGKGFLSIEEGKPVFRRSGVRRASSIVRGLGKARTAIFPLQVSMPAILAGGPLALRVEDPPGVGG